MLTLFYRNQKNKKWQDRPQLYRGRFYFVRQVVQIVAMIGVVTLLAVTFLYFRNSPALGIRHVDVLGDLTHLSHDDVVVLSELKASDKLFAVNLTSVRDNIRRHPWVEDVSIRREFPDTVQITVTEREPLALLMVGDGYLVDKMGRVFKKWEDTDVRDLPVITGFDAEEIARFPALTRQRLNDAVAFLKFLNKQSFFLDDAVSEVNLDAVYGFTVFTLSDGLEIFYGKGDPQTKQAKLEKFKLTKFFTDKRVTRLDLALDGKIIARERAQNN